MRYFTRGWAEGELDDAASQRARDEYASRLDVIGPQLSAPMRSLAREVSLHDAILEAVQWNPGAMQLIMKLVVVVPAGGYEALTLTYFGAMLGERRIETLRAVARDRETEVLYDEVDVDDDDERTLSHRLLFWPDRELTIDFRELRLDRAPRADRRVHLAGAFELVD